MGRLLPRPGARSSGLGLLRLESQMLDSADLTCAFAMMVFRSRASAVNHRAAVKGPCEGGVAQSELCCTLGYLWLRNKPSKRCSRGLQAVAQGSCHSLEGVKLEEVSLRTGDAKLLVRGKLLTADQNASILLTDFPVAMLQPLFRSMPALEHAAPAVGEACMPGI